MCLTCTHMQMYPDPDALSQRRQAAWAMLGYDAPPPPPPAAVILVRPRKTR